MIELYGNWKKGFAYDIHTTDCKFAGYWPNGKPIFDTTYTEMGKLIHQLKYSNPDKDTISKIIDLLQTVDIFSEIDAIIPIPPSKTRDNQPVFLIAEELGKRRALPVYCDFLVKINENEELKNMEQDKRMVYLKSTMDINANANANDLSGKNVLLIDDLYRSGSTLSVAANLLRTKGSLKNIYVLTATKTRSNR